MANVNEILNRIDNYVEAKEQDKLIRETELELQATALADTIVAKYGKRIADIVTVANHLREKGIKFKGTNTWNKHNNYRNDMFIADGFYHQLGLTLIGHYDSQSFATALTYKMGGACGNRTIVFTPTDVYIDLGGFTDKVKECDDIRNLKAFLNEFEDYETAFYEWVEKETCTDGLVTIKDILPTERIVTEKYIITVEKK